MNTATVTDPDIAALREDLAALKRDFAGLLDHSKDRVGDSVGRAAASLDDGARRIADEVGTESARAATAIGKAVEEHPLAALAVAVGVGLIGGRLLLR